MTEVDWEGVKSLIRWELPNTCVCCNVKIRKLNKTRCKPCYFSPASADRKSDPNYFNTGFKPKTIFRKYGVPDKWGKCQLFYFYYNQHLNNEYPYPDELIDINGNYVSKDKINWVIHHIDKNNWNDHMFNLLLCLSTEHKYFEKEEKENLKFINRCLEYYKTL